MTGLVEAFGQLPGPVVVLAHDEVDLAWLPTDAEVWPLRGPRGRGTEEVTTLVVTGPDRDALQREIARLRGLPPARTVGLWCEYGGGPVLPRPRPSMPRVTATSSQQIGAGWFVQATFEEPIGARDGAGLLVRGLFAPERAHGEGPRVGLHPRVVGVPGSHRPAVVRDPASLGEERRLTPPDLLLVPGGTPLTEVATHPSLARPQATLGIESADHGLGPLEERVLNPRGFLRRRTSGTAMLRSTGARILVQGAGSDVYADAGRGATEQMVDALRPVAGLEVGWGSQPDPALARAVAGLAMAGVPVLGAAPAWAHDLLGADVAEALAAPVDLTDELAREEHSVVLRRAALRRHSTRAWRRRIAARLGLAMPSEPTVSVLLATRRPEMLGFALRQVRRQRGVALEVVLAAHGFRPEQAAVAALVEDGLPVVIRSHPADAVFGEVLADAAAVASGDLLLKMDDDDWYGPDFVSDLVLARDYSGADIVGVALEQVYLEPRDCTLRRDYATEVETGVVAGGSMMLAPSTLTAIGGFRSVTRHVDAFLLADARAWGARIHRTHSLGYLHRRGDDGHTWRVGVDHFLDDDRETQVRPGFAPSRLLEPDPQDLPTGD